MSKVDLIVVGVSGLVISVSPGKRVGDVTGRRDNEIFARGTRRLAVSAIIQNVFFEWPPDRGNIICAEGAIMGPIIRARGDCSQPHFNPWPRSSESAAGARRRPISGLPTIRELAPSLYTAPLGRIYPSPGGYSHNRIVC